LKPLSTKKYRLFGKAEWGHWMTLNK